MRVFFSLLLPVSLAAVGTCPVTGPTQLGSGQNLPVIVATIACTADAANGSYPAAAINGLNIPGWQGYYLARVEINPGSPNPTANYSVTVTDAAGVDQLSGQATQLPAAMPQSFGVTASSIPVNGIHTVNVTGNSVNSAIVNISLYWSSGPPPAGRIVAEKGTRWTPSLFSAPAVSVQATVSKAAATGVRHVADCVSFSGASTTAPAATQLNVNLRDGASGAGTIIWTQTVVVLAATGQNVVPFSVCGLNLIGTPNTAMTLEFSALLTNLFEAVSLSGYDIQ